MNILVRLPNWLGDMVMSAAFMAALRSQFPNAEIDVIVKKSLADLAELIPDINEIYTFSKQEYPGLQGNRKFGKMIGTKKQYGVFYSLPDSLSSAVMAWATGSKVRIGYKKEMRGMLLTESRNKPKGLHRVEEYLHLIEETGKWSVSLEHVQPLSAISAHDYIVLNLNSEAQSRRMTVQKGRMLINEAIAAFPHHLVLTGAPNEKAHINAMVEGLPSDRLINLAGSTSLVQLAQALANAKLIISTDSGVAHLGNAFNTPLVVLFGAGNELKTGPFNQERTAIVRLHELECAPCVSNSCKFGEPKCLTELLLTKIIATAKNLMT